MLGPAFHRGWHEAGSTDRQRLEKGYLSDHVLEKMGLVLKDL